MKNEKWKVLLTAAICRTWNLKLNIIPVKTKPIPSCLHVFLSSTFSLPLLSHPYSISICTCVHNSIICYLSEVRMTESFIEVCYAKPCTPFSRRLTRAWEKQAAIINCRLQNNNNTHGSIMQEMSTKIKNAVRRNQSASNYYVLSRLMIRAHARHS